MNNSVVLSAWSIDAFDCLTKKLYTKMSLEQISRAEMFVSAFVLFDSIFLTERYKENNIVKKLNSLSYNSIKFVSSEKLIHSDDMRDHISFDVDLHMLSFDTLAEENDIWQFQNDPDLGYELFFSNHNNPKVKETLNSKFFTNLRLWHWCLANEMAEVTSSVCMLPISLNAVSDFAIRKKNISDFILSRYYDYAKYHNQKFAKFSEALSTPFYSELKYFPPLFSLFLDRCKTSEDAVSVLVSLRHDYSEFRELRHKFTNAIESSNQVSEQYDVISDWNSSWKNLMSGEFKKPNLLRKKITSTDVSTSLISIESGSLKTVIKNTIDHFQYKKSYNLFRIFGDIEENIGNMETDKALLHSKFGVEEIVPLIKITS